MALSGSDNKGYYGRVGMIIHKTQEIFKLKIGFVWDLDLLVLIYRLEKDRKINISIIKQPKI